MSLATVTKILELEEKCERLASPVGESETTRCERAERMIKAAIDRGTFPQGILGNIRIFSQGSFRNSTNIASESDVDVAVCLTDPFFADYSLTRGLTPATFGNVNHPYTFSEYRQAVVTAVTAHFGSAFVTAGNKSIKVRGNTGRVEADVVPCFEYRQYVSGPSPIVGTKFFSRDGQEIINWPEWHYNCGVEKNRQTGMRFKKVVRALKALRAHMRGPTADTPSFLIESLVWNVPNDKFNSEYLLLDCINCLNWLMQALNNPEFATQHLWEVNSLKLLFTIKQAWSLNDASAFVLAASRELSL